MQFSVLCVSRECLSNYICICMHIAKHFTCTADKCRIPNKWICIHLISHIRNTQQDTVHTVQQVDRYYVHTQTRYSVLILDKNKYEGKSRSEFKILTFVWPIATRTGSICMGGPRRRLRNILRIWKEKDNYLWGIVAF